MAPPVRTEPKLIHALPLTRYCNSGFRSKFWF